MPRKTISEVISAAAAATPRTTLELDPKVAATEDANEFYEDSYEEDPHQAQRRFALPGVDRATAVKGGAAVAVLAIAANPGVAEAVVGTAAFGATCGAVIGAAAFGATCIAESMLRQEGQK